MVSKLTNEQFSGLRDAGLGLPSGAVVKTPPSIAGLSRWWGNKDSTCHGVGPKVFLEKKRDVVLCLRNIKQEGESKRPGDKKSLSSVA